MRMTDRNAGQPCRVIPFKRPAQREEQLTTSSIAAGDCRHRFTL
jgi:hypothetical protein